MLNWEDRFVRRKVTPDNIQQSLENDERWKDLPLSLRDELLPLMMQLPCILSDRRLTTVLNIGSVVDLLDAKNIFLRFCLEQPITDSVRERVENGLKRLEVWEIKRWGRIAYVCFFKID
jgi:hypothetical protein